MDEAVGLQRFGECRSCGETVSWVTVPGRKPGGGLVLLPVNLEPSALGELALLRDGVRAYPIAGTATLEPIDLDGYDTVVRLVCHFRTCDALGLRTAEYSALELTTRRRSATERERIRARKLAADRAKDGPTWQRPGRRW